MSGEGGGGVHHAGWAGDGSDDYRDAMLPAVAMVMIVVEKGLVMVEEVMVVVMTWRRWGW